LQHHLKNIVVLHTGYSTDNHGVRFWGFRLAELYFSRNICASHHMISRKTNFHEFSFTNQIVCLFVVIKFFGEKNLIGREIREHSEFDFCEAM